MTDLTAEDHHSIAQASQLDGSICAVLALLFAAAGITWLITLRVEGLLLIAVAWMLLAAANRAFTCADLHHSAAHQEDVR